MHDINLLKKQELLKIRGDRLRRLRLMMGMTIAEMSKCTNFSTSSIHKWEKGRAGGVTENNAFKIVHAVQQENIDCSVQWLLGEDDLQPAYKTSPKQTEITIAPEEKTVSIIKTIEDEIKYFKNITEHSVTYYVNDDSMEPFFYRGDYVGGIKLFGHPINQLNGEICIVQTEDQKMYLRKLISNISNQSFSLYSINPMTTIVNPVIANVNITWPAPVLRLWRSKLKSLDNE